MSSQPLTYLHLLTPFLLSIPILTLLPPPNSPPDELPGVRPITIRTVTPRRAIILTILSLLADTSFADAAILVAELLSTQGGEKDGTLEGLSLASRFVYAIGGFLVWMMAAIFCEWRAKWGDKGVLTLGLLGMVCEIPNLVLLVIRELHTHGSGKLFTILSLVPSALRLLHLPVLLVIVLSPIIRYKPADESTSLLNANGGPSTPNGREAYGTFPNDEENGAAKAGVPPGQANATGTNTPAAQKQSITIPKNLGEVKKEDKPLPLKEILEKLKKLSPRLWPSTSRKLQIYCVLCMGLLLFGRVLQPLVPLSLGEIVRRLTRIQNGAQKVSPWPPFIAYFVIRLAVSGSGILSFLQQRLWIPISQYTDREMMLLCFNHLLNLSLAYHTKRNTGEVLKIIDRGSAINNLFQTILFTALPTILDIIITFAVFLYLYGGLLAFLTLGVMITYIVFSVTMTQQRVATRRLLIDKDVKQRGIVSDVLTNWESVKYFTAEHRESTRFGEAILSYQETEAKWNRNWQLLFLIQNALLALGLMTGSLIISYRVLGGTADAAEFVVFVQYFQQLSGPLDRLGSLYRQLNQNTTDAEKMFTLLSQATEVNDKPGARDLVVTDGVIEFDNVCFSYDSKVEALRGVSFKIEKGQSMALIGESGSGKSTILRLLYRFYDITSGHIYIDGQDISEVTQVSLRRAIGIVPQDSVLWNDTIGANISYGKEGATDEEIIDAAKAARMHERILSFTDDYSTIVGERGVRLSGGEKQRVSLARMFLKSPAILVLDEATSALDTETEREIQRALADLARGRSSLSIAHRLSTIINSDQIVVMKDGQVVENGGYKELLDLNGSFATMWKKQIFTEAEMVAQAEGVEPEDIAKTLPNEEDIVKRVKNGSDSGGDLAVIEGRDKKTEDKEAAGKGSQPDPTSGFDVKVSTAKAIEPESSSSYAEGAKNVPDLDTKASPENEPVQEAVSADPASNGLPEVEPSPALGDTTTATVPHPSFTPDPATEADSGPSRSSPPSSPRIESEETEPSTDDTLPYSSAPVKQIAVPFPSMARLNTSQSTHSNLSELESGSTSDVAELPADGKDRSKARKRLSSIKGLVRRISDQGASRSHSSGRPASSGKSPMGELDEETAMLSKGVVAGTPNGESSDKKKKRLSSQKKT